VVQSIRLTTRAGSERIVRFAFEYIKNHGRRKLSVIHKANIMKMADGLFLDCGRRVKADFPDVEYEELIVDNAAMQLMANPYRFDVLLLPNLYGDILSDLVGGLAGGLGTVPSMSVNRDLAVFEAIHGYAPQLVGTDWANPMTLLCSATHMLRHLGEIGPAKRIDTATERVIRDGKVRTPDMGGTATTTDLVKAIVAAFP
jgi:isocitrate dehydrogenase (NAD+)